MALKNNKGQGEIMAKGALMYSDYNYRQFNPKLLIEHEEESVTGKQKEGEDSESKSDIGSQKENQIKKDELKRAESYVSLPKSQIDEIMAAQGQDELADLVPLKICVQSDNYGTNVFLYENYKKISIEFI